MSLIKRIAILAMLSQIVFADGHPYNAERAKALDDYTNEIAKHPEYTPEQKLNVKKQFLDKAVENTKKTLREQARGSGKPPTAPDTEQAAVESFSHSNIPKAVPSKTTGTTTSSQSKGPSTQKRVTSTSTDKVESGGAHEISFKRGSNDAITGGAATIGEGEAASGGAEEIQFGGKK